MPFLAVKWAAASLCLVSISSWSSATPCLDEDNHPITSCTRCLAYPSCEWCPTQNPTDKPAIGCIVKGSQTCPNTTVTPEYQVEEDGRPLSNRKGDYVQIFPQLVNLTLSPRTRASLTFDVALAEVPVDIYFVMDLSNSMKNHKNNLVASTEKISNAIKSLTKDCRFGFGSFSDKPTVPFSAELAWYHSAAGARSQPDPYSFHHQMSLTSDIEQFRRGVQNARLAANVDSAEAGMDALMQVITCHDELRWRDEVRKVIVFITDEDTHYAMDGILAGITKPQDGHCHLRRENVRGSTMSAYSESLQQDYPSFGQIRDQLKDKNMAVVFAVGVKLNAKEVEMTQLYKDLSMFIQGTENVGRLTKDASSIVTIVESQYRAIKGTISLRWDSSHKEDIKVSLKSNCHHVTNPNDQTVYTCLNVKESVKIQVALDITMKNESLCLGRMRDEEKYVEISLAGFPKDKLKVSLKCETCQCGRESFGSPICNRNGKLVCGGCECNAGYFGDACQCSMAKGADGDAMSMKDLEDQCREEDGSSLCNGRGHCTCGHCACNAKYLGEYCQCTRDTCPQNAAGQICSTNGACKCNSTTLTTHCDCAPGWEGPDCSCTKSTESCIDVYTGEVCFGHGRCECGSCTCHDGYQGKFCQFKAGEDSCKVLEPCVKMREFAVERFQGDKVAAELIEQWREECRRQTSFGDIRLFDFESFSHFGCPLPSSPNATEPASDDVLLYKINIRHNCASTLAQFWNEKQAEDDSFGEDGQNQLEASTTTTTKKPLILRGDVSIDQAILENYIKSARTRGMKRCIGVHENCEFTFYQEHVLENSYFDEKHMIHNVYIVHRNVSGTWQAITTCYQLPLAIVMGTTVGALLFIALGLLIAAVVAINLRDLRRWQQYQAWKAENERRLGDYTNPLYQEKGSAQTTVLNPVHGKD